MEHNIIQEKDLRPVSGFAMLAALIFGYCASTYLFIAGVIGLATERFLSGGLMFGAAFLG